MGNIFEEHFSHLPDPRVERTKKHKLIDIIAIAMCGVISGADNWVEIEAFGQIREAWLREFLELPNGIPSHDTFGRVFARLDADAFRRSFIDWVRTVHSLTAGQVVAIDGKTIRGSADKTNGKAALHVVSAWASENALVLGQLAVDEQSNEITAIPQLLAMLVLDGCIVTADAMGCQKTIAQTIRAAKADYVLRVKANHGQLFEDLQDWFAHAEHSHFAQMTHSHDRIVNKDHGRLEIRECWVVSDPVAFEYIRHYDGWADLNSIAKVVRQRQIGETLSTDTAFYISSLQNDAKLLLACSRTHWAIENSLHWILDVAFREDHARYRRDDGAENFALLRKLAINLLRQDKSVKIGAKGKRLRAALDPAYLLHLLNQ
jgi:predicted transposase YbfD/YdcC